MAFYISNSAPVGAEINFHLDSQGWRARPLIFAKESAVIPAAVGMHHACTSTLWNELRKASLHQTKCFSSPIACLWQWLEQIFTTNRNRCVLRDLSLIHPLSSCLSGSLLVSVLMMPRFLHAIPFLCCSWCQSARSWGQRATQLYWGVWQAPDKQLSYEGCSKSKAFYFIMLAQNIRGRCW